MSVFTLPAQATMAEAAALVARLGDDTDAVDAGALQAFDTAAVAVLLEARRRAERRGTAFRLLNPPPKLVELARLYGVDELLVST